MQGLAFAYRIEFQPTATPRGLKIRFEAALREEVLFAHGLDCFMSELAHAGWTYGVVYRPGGDVTPDDRRRIAEWIRSQPVRCRVTLGDLEPMETTDVTRPVTGLPFEVDNLPEAGGATRDDGENRTRDLRKASRFV